ncbi:MAG: SDR family NAD(P)-dependent oxidoreductase, partial [Lentisphaeria bacterium]|nr:SDR family NAD(P)-dependent oxidoreductase [Lentisphaeria bacterium]
MKQGVLQGKRVLVTGGAIRVGAVLVRAFADAGAEVLVHCRTNAEAAAELPAARILTCDLTEPGAPERLIADAGKLDILINNASAYIRKPFETETQADVQAMLDINFFAPLALMKAFAMTCNPDACIINLLD